jgi:hypothetical protein
MHRRLVALSAVLVLGLATTACNSKDKNNSSAGDATTTTVAPTTSTSTTVPSGPAATPQAAADGLYGAWVHGNTQADRDNASRYAKTQAINKLFEHP